MEEFEWIVSEIRGDNEMCVAAGTAPNKEDAFKEGHHYLTQYLQDGPASLEVFQLQRVSLYRIVPAVDFVSKLIGGSDVS